MSPEAWARTTDLDAVPVQRLVIACTRLARGLLHLICCILLAPALPDLRLGR